MHHPDTYSLNPPPPPPSRKQCARMIVKLTYEPCCVVQPFFLGPDVKKARFHSPPSSAEDKVKRFFYYDQFRSSRTTIFENTLEHVHRVVFFTLFLSFATYRVFGHET